MPDKERERHYLAQLRKCVELPSGEPSEAEPPDFILGSAPSRVGIEFTEYHHPPEPGQRPFQEIQSLKDRIVEVASAIHDRSGGQPLYVYVQFGHAGSLTKDCVRPYAESIATALRSFKLPISLSDPQVRIPSRLLPPEIVAVCVNGSVHGADKLWKANSSGWQAQISPEHVQSVLTRKATIVTRARQRCDALWLVIVHNFVRGAPSELAAAALDAPLEHPFDRALWLDPHLPHAYEIRARAGSRRRH